MEMCRWFFQGFTETRNWHRPIVWDDQECGKDEFTSTELVLPDECHCLTIIRKDKWYLWEGLVNLLASSPTGKWKFRPISSPARADQLQFFVGATTQKLSQKLFKFYNHIPHDMEMCRWFFKGFTETQNGHHVRINFIFFWCIYIFSYMSICLTTVKIWLMS